MARWLQQTVQGMLSPDLKNLRSRCSIVAVTLPVLPSILCTVPSPCVNTFALLIAGHPYRTIIHHYAGTTRRQANFRFQRFTLSIEPHQRPVTSFFRHQPGRPFTHTNAFYNAVAFCRNLVHHPVRVRIDLVNSLVAAIGDPNSAFAYTDALIFT